jgi:hypothetical protein
MTAAPRVTGDGRHYSRLAAEYYEEAGVSLGWLSGDQQLKVRVAHRPDQGVDEGAAKLGRLGSRRHCSIRE